MAPTPVRVRNRRTSSASPRHAVRRSSARIREARAGVVGPNGGLGYAQVPSRAAEATARSTRGHRRTRGLQVLGPRSASSSKALQDGEQRQTYETCPDVTMGFIRFVLARRRPDLSVEDVMFSLAYDL